MKSRICRRRGHVDRGRARAGDAAVVPATGAAGVERFVFVSMAGLTDAMVARSPLAVAKRRNRLLASWRDDAVIVRPPVRVSALTLHRASNMVRTATVWPGPVGGEPCCDG